MLQFVTKNGTSPNNKAWVFLCALPEEVQNWLAMIREDIFRFSNCAIWYDDGVATASDDLKSAIDQSAMAILPVTAPMLNPDSAIQRHILPLLQTYQVSILPILNDPNLLDAFNAQFRNIQVLDRYSKDLTAIPYEEKLERFLDSMLLRDDLADRIRQAFRSQLFLSYRKKDRGPALDLIKQIHRDPQCRRIRLWYDEFLTLGEDFDNNIHLAIQESDLFLLALTKNMVNEDNYVIESEYPCAKNAAKKILPVVLEPIDCQQAHRRFPGISTLLDSTDAIRHLAQLMDQDSEPTPEQDYLLGLAYLRGLHVERQVSLGLEQLERSAQRGYAPAALQLANTQILEQDIQEQKARQLKWLRKYAALAAADYKQTPNAETAQQYADALDRVASAEFEQHPQVAFILYEQAIQVLESHHCLAQSAQICSNYGLKLVDAERNQDGLQMLMKALQQYSDQYKADAQWGNSHTGQYSYCYYNTGNAATRAGNLELAQIAYKAAIQNFTVLAQKDPEEYTLVLAQAYGNLGSIYRQQWVRSKDPELCTKAEAYHNKALDILNQVIDWAPEVYEPAFALELISLSAIYLQKPDFTKAELMLDNAIKILQAYEEMYPGQHLDALATALGNRAVLFLSQDNTQKARGDLDASIRIFREAPGRHMELAKALWNMALTYSVKEDFRHARQYYEEAAAIYESGEVQGSEFNPDYAQCCHNFANALCHSGEYLEALTWANHAVDIYSKLQGSSGESFASQLDSLRHLTEWLSKML